MPYQINYRDNIVHVQFSGRVSTEELLELDKEIFANYDKDDCLGHLYNYLEVEAVTWREVDIKRIALLDKNESFVIGPLKIAILVVDEAVAKYSRLYAEGLEGSEWQAALFANETDALTFITNN